MKHLPAIHGLRALAALAIVAFHVPALAKMPLPSELAFIGTHFGLGVTLFFVLSAFSLMHSTSPSYGSDGWITRYLTKRFFRIAPLFYFFIFVEIGRRILLSVPLPLSTYLLNFSFLFNLIPERQTSVVFAGWTIGVEMLFYLLFPLVLAMARTLPRGIAIFAVCLLISIVFRIQFTDVSDARTAHYSFGGNLVFFASGVVGYLAIQKLEFPKIPGWVFWVATLAIALLIYSNTRTLRTLSPNWNADTMLWSMLFAAIAAWQAKYPSAFLSSRPMQWLGERSFSLYLCHPWVIYVLFLFGIYSWIGDRFTTIGNWTYVIGFVVTVLALAATSAVTYALIEKPGMALGKRVIRGDFSMPAFLRRRAAGGDAEST